MKRLDLIARAAALVVVLAAAAVLIGEREPPSSRLDLPEPPVHSSKHAHQAAAAKGSTDLGVAFRLVDMLGRAVYDAPEITRVESHLHYWRRMRSPYAGPGGSLGRVVEQVAIVSRGGQHTEPMGIKGGKQWIPDKRIWDMAEGSFDQREAILAPPPATIRYHLTLPAGAVFEAAPAVVGRLTGRVEFLVAMRRNAGKEQVLGSRVFDKLPRRWVDWRIDLAKYAGETVDLELKTRWLPRTETPAEDASSDDASPPPSNPPTRLAAPGAGSLVARRPSAAALWGTPVVLAPRASSMPFNVLFFVIDATRGDAIAATHDAATDAKMADAEHPPLDAWLPRMPEVAPNLDALATSGVIFTHAHSSAMWTRPGTVAMLTGTRSGDLGLSPTALVPRPAQVERFYARHPPFLPLLLRPHGVTTRAFVNNFYMVGYAGVGVDMGFEGVRDHRYPLADTAMIENDTLRWLDHNSNRRFCLFVNFNSPHSPYLPPKRDLDAVPGPPEGPADPNVRKYLGEIHKDDAAIGRIIAELGRLKIRHKTFVVVTADHGETLSQLHTAVAVRLDGRALPSARFHHLSTMWDETTRIPIIMSYPDGLPKGKRVAIPVQSVDIVPTILDLAGLPKPDVMDGRSLVPLIRGTSHKVLPVVVEGRGAYSLEVGHWHLIARQPIAQLMSFNGEDRIVKNELYDLSDDPGERVNLAHQKPGVVKKLTAELDEILRAKHEQHASSKRSAKAPTIRLRFATGGDARHVMGTLMAQPLRSGRRARLQVTLVGLPASAERTTPDGVALDFSTQKNRVVGVNVKLDPPTADLDWAFSLDGQPWPKDRVYAGAFGLRASSLAGGIDGESGRVLASAFLQPLIDPERDVGLFVTRDLVSHEIDLKTTAAASEETMQLMRAWGYVRESQAQKP